MARGHRHLIIQVIDGSPDRPVTPDLPTVAAPFHHPDLNRGLLLVDAAADRWGCWPVNGGKAVRAALAYAP